MGNRGRGKMYMGLLGIAEKCCGGILHYFKLCMSIVLLLARNYWISVIPVLILVGIICISIFLYSVDSGSIGFKVWIVVLGAWVTFSCSFGGLFISNFLKNKLDKKTKINDTISICRLILSEINTLSSIGKDLAFSKRDFSFVNLTDYPLEMFIVYKSIVGKLMLLSAETREAVVKLYCLIDLYSASFKELSPLKTKYNDVDYLVQYYANYSSIKTQMPANNAASIDMVIEEKNSEKMRLFERIKPYEETVVKIHNELLKQVEVATSLLNGDITDNEKKLRLFM
jgi:hypothetical protein